VFLVSTDRWRGPGRTPEASRPASSPQDAGRFDGRDAMHIILRYTINGAKFRRIYTDQRAALVRADVLRASGVEVAIATKAKA